MNKFFQAYDTDIRAKSFINFSSSRDGLKKTNNLSLDGWES